jgi:hypothetical protein
MKNAREPQDLRKNLTDRDAVKSWRRALVAADIPEKVLRDHQEREEYAL